MLKLRISKLEAARRQLSTAIELWFRDGDPISIHTLAAAAYEIVDRISKKKHPDRQDLIFDSIVIKDEYRGEWIRLVKAPANFFKHADTDPNAVFEFDPATSDFFLLFTVQGIRICGEDLNKIELAFFLWNWMSKPDLLTKDGRKLIQDRVPEDQCIAFRDLPKWRFLELFLQTPYI